MIIPFLTDEQFVARLSLFIFVYVLICITKAYCAKRQPTDYDTLWMRRWRIISGVSWIILAVGSIFVYNHFPLQFYCQNVYGTVTPTQDMIATGISPYLPVHNPDHSLVWGRLTFRQWQIETNVTNILRYLALGIYFILFKPSSVKKWVKVRKFIGYVILLFFLPATINFRYFDTLEIIPVLVVLLIVYLLLRTYKHDAIVPVAKEPLKTSDGSIIKEFAPITPEEKVETSQNNNLRGIYLKLRKDASLIMGKLSAFCKKATSMPITKINAFPKKKKRGIISLIVILILAICIGIGYAVYVLTYHNVSSKGGKEEVEYIQSHINPRKYFKLFGGNLGDPYSEFANHLKESGFKQRPSTGSSWTGEISQHEARISIDTYGGVYIRGVWITIYIYEDSKKEQDCAFSTIYYSLEKKYGRSHTRDDEPGYYWSLEEGDIELIWTDYYISVGYKTVVFDELVSDMKKERMYNGIKEVL